MQFVAAQIYSISKNRFIRARFIDVWSKLIFS
jgi:hypothetical protein